MAHARYRHEPRWHRQRDELHGSATEESWQSTGLPIARTRVPGPPTVPSHSAAALEAQAHALIERAGAFAPPAMPAEYRAALAPPPFTLGVQPF